MPADPPSTLTDRQHRIDQRIMRELVLGTPSHWTRIELLVDIARTDGVVELAVTLHSPEGHDPAEAEVTVGLTTALAELAHLFHHHGMQVSRLRGVARRVDARWRYAYTLA